MEVLFSIIAGMFIYIISSCIKIFLIDPRNEFFSIVAKIKELEKKHNPTYSYSLDSNNIWEYEKINKAKDEYRDVASKLNSFNYIHNRKMFFIKEKIFKKMKICCFEEIEEVVQKLIFISNYMLIDDKKEKEDYKEAIDLINKKLKLI